MPVTGIPPAYRRGTSFTRYAIDRPTTPLPGDRLDQELDDIAAVLDGRAAELEAFVGANGQLRHGIIAREQLAPGLFDDITVQGARRITPLLSEALEAAERAGRYAEDAGGFATSVQRAADAAYAAAGQAMDVKQAIDARLTDTAQLAAAVDEDEALAKNSADTAEAYMVQAEAARDMAEKWAEYLAGPVEPAPPGWPEAIDDGMWSSKWWAVRASEIVEQMTGWYLGAFASDPGIPSEGPWPPGTMYYNTTTGQMLVWDGLQWGPIAEPSPAGAKSYVYLATANQATFGGADMRGNTPTMTNPPQPSTVY